MEILLIYDICKENNITTIKQALACKEIWSLDNGISLCYSCNKNLERLRTKMKICLLLLIDIQEEKANSLIDESRIHCTLPYLPRHNPIKEGTLKTILFQTNISQEDFLEYI